MCFWLPRTGIAVLIFLLKMWLDFSQKRYMKLSLLVFCVKETAISLIFVSAWFCFDYKRWISLRIHKFSVCFCTLHFFGLNWVPLNWLESTLPHLSPADSLCSWVTCGCNPHIIQLLAAWGSPSFSECHWWTSHRWIEGDFLSVYLCLHLPLISPGALLT